MPNESTPLFELLGFTAVSTLSLIIISALVSYLSGSIPAGLLAARWIKGIDIREAGSGNIGATNVSRIIGARWGLMVLLIDALKGYLPVFGLALLFFSNQPHWQEHVRVLCGVFAILGHMFPLWLKFRGGKGVATTLGVLLALSPESLAVAFIVFAISFAGVRIVSLSSLLAAVAFGAFEFYLLLPHPFNDRNWSLALFSLVIPLLIIIRHRTNLVRIIRGQEQRFQFKKTDSQAEIPE